jgi:hypothetical protein
VLTIIKISSKRFLTASFRNIFEEILSLRKNLFFDREEKKTDWSSENYTENTA